MDLQLARSICAWFDRHARDLPWRRRRNGYTALVAETMLQQTQASRVVDRFDVFLKRFPNVRILAAADEQDVLAMWQGLGYYRRARGLHQAAKLIVGEFSGRVPREIDQLRQLPGVGRYTAGAIASIVHGRAEPIVDGNVQRLLMRIRANRASPDFKSTRNWAWRTADELVKSAPRPGVFNEGLMELGATVCAPKSPRCDACPVSGMCKARQRGVVDSIPQARSRPNPQAAHHHAVIITRGRKVLFEQRPREGMWGSLWQVPTIETTTPLSVVEIKGALPISVDKLTECGQFVHHTTHRTIHFRVLRGSTRIRRGTWRAIDDLDDLPMSNAHKRVLSVMTSVR